MDQQVQMKSGSIRIDSSGTMSIKGEAAYLEALGDVNIKGGTVWIDDIVQLASGSADGAFTAFAPNTSSPGNEIKTKQEVQPAKFDDAAAAAGGDTASQAKAAEPPASAQSGSAGPSSPPDRHPPSLTKVASREMQGPNPATAADVQAEIDAARAELAALYGR